MRAMEGHRHESRQDRIERTRREVAARLRPVCADMPQAEFDQLVEDVAAVSIKYAVRRADDLFRTPEKRK